MEIQWQLKVVTGAAAAVNCDYNLPIIYTVTLHWQLWTVVVVKTFVAENKSVVMVMKDIES